MQKINEEKEKKKTKQKKETGRKYYMKKQSTYTGYRAAA